MAIVYFMHIGSIDILTAAQIMIEILINSIGIIIDTIYYYANIYMNITILYKY